MTMDSETFRRQHERHERVTEPFVQDMLSAFSLFLWPDINKRMEIEKTTNLQVHMKIFLYRNCKNKIKCSRAIFLRKGKCLGSSCSDHPASLHKWGPWYHRETRIFQLHSFVRKEREVQRQRIGNNFFCFVFIPVDFWKNILTMECNFVAVIHLLKITTFLKYCL